MATPEPLDVPNGLADEFVTVVNVQPTTATSSAESFVTVLSIGAGKRGAPSDDKTQPASNGVDPAHPEEEVDIYRLPGERLGFGLKFEGGNKTSERVRRLFVQSCAEQSPASRAKCSWGHLGEGDEVLSIDGVSVTEMTRLDCVRRLKESQLVIKLLVRYRGALRPEVVSAERKHDQHQQRSKIPPELPAAPPPVPPRKSRHSTQSANRGPADGEASPGAKKPWDSPKSAGSSQNGSPQSQGSYRSAASSGTRSSTYESCASSPAKSIPGSKNESPKAHVSPVLSKTKQEPPAEAQWYLDARSQDGSSTHGSTSDDTSSSLSTVVDRFSSSDRFSTTSTASTTSEQQLYHPADIAPDLLDDALLTPATTAPSVATTNGCCSDLSSPDFLLARLANSEARTHVESRGDVERVTTVVAPNTVLIEETPALQPPLCFQDAPLSYGHEPRPGIFYTADLAADSRTHFRPIKDDAEMVEKVVNGDRVAPPLPARNHVNRIPVNQQMKQPTNGEERKEEEVEETKTSPQLPPKPMPRKDVKAKRKRPPPPPPPPRRENPPPVPEARHFDSCGGTKKVEMVKTDSEAGEEKTSRLSVEVFVEDRQRDEEVEAEGTPKTHKVLEIVEMRKAMALPPQKAPSRTSVADEVPEGGDGASTSQGVEEGNVHGVEEISACQRALLEMHVVNTVSIDVEDSEDGDGGTEGFEEKNGKKWEVETEDEVAQVVDEEETSGFREERMEDVQDIVQLNTVENVRLLDAIRDGAKESMDEGEISDESDGEDYYWQSNLATIGEEEENNSLEYDEANEISVPPVTKPLEKPQIIEDIVETALPALSDKIARDEPDCVSRIASDSKTLDKKQDKSAVNGRMDNCGGGGQRLPPDGDEFPAAYQEFTSPSQQYQYVTTRETMAANGDVDRGESVVDGANPFLPADKATLVTKKGRSIFDKKDMLSEFMQKEVDADKRSSVGNYVIYSAQKSLASEKKIEMAGYYAKGSDEGEVGASPPPLPLTGPPKVEARAQSQERKFASNSDLWRQDNKSEKSVKDKIAMFSSQSSAEAPLFPTSIAAGSPRRLSKHKSSDDVFGEDKRPTVAERTQSTFDLTDNGHLRKKVPNLPQTSPPSSPGGVNGYSSGGSSGSSPIHLQKSREINNCDSSGSSMSSSPLSSYSTAYSRALSPSLGKSYEASPMSSPVKAPAACAAVLTRATSFSGSLGPYGADALQASSKVPGGTSSIARTTSLASTFKRPSDEMRKSSLNQLIEQRRKGMSKLRGLVIPEKDAVSVDQPIIDLPEIKSRESILLNQVPRSNIHDKWGSQSSLASNASTVSSSMRTNTSFKMPAPKILSSYSPAFKRKTLTSYNNNSSAINGSKGSANTTTNSQLSSPASDAPKSLESICSPTRSDYSFDFVSSSGSPENNHPASKPKLNCQRKIGRNEYDDSDNDSAVSSSQSSISRGFSPPASPVPSDRSTISSERSYLSSETHYQRPQLIMDSKTNGTTIVPDKVYNGNNHVRSTLISERSYSVPEKTTHLKQVHQQQQPAEQVRSSHIPQRQMLKRSNSTETNSSNSSTLTSGSQASAESLSRRVLKPQSVEAINRKNILASARCRSGRDLNGSPLIQRKFTDEEEAGEQQESGVFVNAHRVSNGNADHVKPEIKIAYIEIAENVEPEDGKKEMNEEPRFPPKRSVVIPQAKNVPIPTSRPPKPEAMEPSNDIKSWVRSEMRNLTTNSNDRTNSYDSRKKTLAGDEDISSSRNFRSKSTLALNEQSPSTTMGSRSQSIDGEGDVDLIDSIKPKSRSNYALKKTTDNDLLAVLTTKSRSRSAIHMEDGSYGQLKSQMGLEDILTTKGSELSSSKLPRSLSISSDTRTTSEKVPEASIYSFSKIERRSNSADLWSEEKTSSTKIPSLSGRTGKLFADNLENSTIETSESSKQTNSCSKIPMSRNLGRRSASVTDMKKVFEKVDHNSSTGAYSLGGQSANVGSHNRFPSLDSSVEENIRPVGGVSACEPDTERFNGEQFGSISSLASSTSLISQQELAQLVEEANLEEPRGGHDVAVVLLHKENPTGSVGIILAGGADCETKEITIHRVLSHSIADKEGSVHRGDRILSINGRSMRGLTHRESLAVLKQPRSEVVLVVSRAKAEDGAKPEATTVSRFRSRTESVSSAGEGYKTNGVVDNTAWGPPMVVAMYKVGTGLGFSLEGGHDSPLGDRPLLIKKIFTGGAAEKTGALRAGDELLEVNNRDVSRMSRIEAWSLMKKLPDGEVSLLVRHPATKSS